jgi:hypothetical protein
MKPKIVIKTKWSPKLAYAIGLITTDGNLAKDARHITFVSKDIELVKTFCRCLGIKNKICLKRGGFVNSQFSSFVQFTNVKFYNFLLSVGLMPAKSKILNKIIIPDKYFFHFLRGHFDGDGTFYSYWDPRWRSSFMFYTVFISASKKHIEWLKERIFKLLRIKGHITKSGNQVCYQLKYAKKESLKLLPKIYGVNNKSFRLERKYKKVYNALAVDRKNP